MSSPERPRSSIRSLGADWLTSGWLDYRAVLPPEEYDEAMLLRLLADESFFDAPEGSALLWVPLHAWRALAQMGSLAVLEPTLRLAESGYVDAAYRDFPEICARIGVPAVEALVAIFRDHGRSESDRGLAADGLGAIAPSAPAPTRARIVSVLMDQIRTHPDEDNVNAIAAEALIAMEERSVAPELLRLYEEGHFGFRVRLSEAIALFQQETPRERGSTG